MAHSNPPNSIPLKVMIDKKNQRVAFAEADATFTDTLVSFLTIPLGTVIKILLSSPELPPIGSTKNLYQSVMNLQPDMFYNSDCKTMLLHPQNASCYAYRSLKFKVDSSDWEAQETKYFCTNECSFSLYEGMKCYCGREMTKKSVIGFQAQSTAFINERIKLLIGEDMRLLPLSMISVATLLQDKRLTDKCNLLERKDVHVEVLQLLVNVLFSATPLTDIVFPKKLHTIYAPKNATFQKNPKEEQGTAEDKARKIKVKLILRKSDKKLLYAEAESDFIDLVFSFLTIPTGAIVKMLGGNPPMKSLDSLSRSINDSSIGNLLKPYSSKELLVNPKLAPSFKCDNQLLDLIQEVYPESYSGRYDTKVKLRNPKSRVGSSSDGGNFMKELEMFMVTDDLVVTPLASTDIVSLLDGFKVPICNVEEILITVGKCEALNLLKASLGSTTVLTDVFRTFLETPKKEP